MTGSLDKDVKFWDFELVSDDGSAAYVHVITLCASGAAVQDIVIGPVCGFVCVCVCLWICYHDNSKLRASILTKLGL